MKIYLQPERDKWPGILQRPVIETALLNAKVNAILNDVRFNGDNAVKNYTSQFDGAVITDLKVTENDIEAAEQHISDELKQAISKAIKNITLFHQHQITEPVMVETMPGVKCWRKSVAIEKVGLYIPGGTAPLFSTVLMLALPAKIAGCKEIILCSPPGRNGRLHPAILYAAKAVGVTAIYKMGGVQAIAAMAYGTETVSSVNKIFGPGNQYVTVAKQLVQQQGIAIDMPAGPSEVLVLADETANAAFIAADLLSQAEHGVDSQSILVTDKQALIEEVKMQAELQLEILERKDIAKKALKNGKLIYLPEKEDIIDMINNYAPEHLIICSRQPEFFTDRIFNAGSVFLGNFSPESVGDYASGTNHTLPTNGFAKTYSGISVDSFVKKITYQQLSEDGLKNIAETVITMANAEGLQAHAQAVKIRLENL